MTDLPVIQPITEDDLLLLNAEGRVEIIDGEAIEMAPVGFMHVLVAGNIFRILDAHVRQHNLGFVASDNLIYVLFRNPDGTIDQSRIPDISFIRKADFPNFDLSKPFPGAPTLAIEVISPSEKSTDTNRKMADLFAAGTTQIWVVYPDSKEVHQYFDRETLKIHHEQARFTAESLFPQLTLDVRDFFTIPDWMTQDS